jgi:death-on-curing protein
LAQPMATFDGADLYPTLAEKAAALGFSLIQGHPKRIGHAAMEVFLVLNGFELDASIDEQEAIVLALAAGNTTREVFADWIRQHAIPLTAPA